MRVLCHEVHGTSSSAVARMPAVAHHSPRRTMQAIPQCLAVHFAAADVQEASGQPQEAAKVYEALLPPPPAAAEGEAPASKVALTAEQQALVWIQYMRFVRRSEGRDKSRKVRRRGRGTHAA